MTIIPIEGERGRFRITSQSRPALTFLVDIVAHNGLGQCDCEHWRARIGPRVDAGDYDVSDAFR